VRPASTIAAAASRLRLFSLRELAVHRRRTIASIAVMAISAMYLVAVFGIFGSITGSVSRLADGQDFPTPSPAMSQRFPALRQRHR
jgi:putative ABC transport system permease protein